MTLGRCPLSIFCSRGTLPEPTNPESISRENVAKFKGLSVTLSVGTLICPYGIAYRRAYGLSTSRMFKKALCSFISHKVLLKSFYHKKGSNPDAFQRL